MFHREHLCTAVHNNMANTIGHKYLGTFSIKANAFWLHHINFVYRGVYTLLMKLVTLIFLFKLLVYRKYCHDHLCQI